MSKDVLKIATEGVWYKGQFFKGPEAIYVSQILDMQDYAKQEGLGGNLLPYTYPGHFTRAVIRQNIFEEVFGLGGVIAGRIHA